MRGSDGRSWIVTAMADCAGSYRFLPEAEHPNRSASEATARLCPQLQVIVGSSLIIITGTKPQISGYPALGIVGFVCSAFIGLTITWGILRNGRDKPSDR
jgi:hypothetical protein